MKENQLANALGRAPLWEKTLAEFRSLVWNAGERSDRDPKICALLLDLNSIRIKFIILTKPIITVKFTNWLSTLDNYFKQMIKILLSVVYNLQNIQFIYVSLVI